VCSLQLLNEIKVQVKLSQTRNRTAVNSMWSWFDRFVCESWWK